MRQHKEGMVDRRTSLLKGVEKMFASHPFRGRELIILKVSDNLCCSIEHRPEELAELFSRSILV